MHTGFIIASVIITLIGAVIHFIFDNLAEGEAAVEADLRKKDVHKLDPWELHQLPNARIDAEQHRVRAEWGKLLTWFGIALFVIGIVIWFLK